MGTQVNGVDCGSGTVPVGIEDNFAVFYSGDNIVGFRDIAGNYYDAMGAPSSVSTIRLNGQARQTNNNITQEMFKDFEPQLTLLPRVRTSYRLKDKSILFASYGLYAQAPSPFAFATLADFETTGSLNNTNLSFEHITKASLGFHHQITNQISASILGFYYRSKDLLTATEFFGATPSTFSGTINRDKSTTKGVEIGLTVTELKYFTADVNYTISFAEGPVGQVAESIVFLFESPPNVSDVPQDFDQRHRLNATLQFATEANTGPEIIGLHPFANLNAKVVIQAGSGFAYTSVIEPFNLAGGRRSAMPASGLNALRMPSSMRIDLQIGREFFYANRTSATLFLLVQNLFDHTNINRVWPYSGQVNDDGFLSLPGGQRFLQDSPPNTETIYQHRNRIPTWTGIPRLIQLGLRLNF